MSTTNELSVGLANVGLLIRSLLELEARRSEAGRAEAGSWLTAVGVLAEMTSRATARLYAAHFDVLGPLSPELSAEVRALITAAMASASARMPGAGGDGS